MDAIGHAVVLGGGIAGLLAARVLSDTCEQVMLVDRDDLTAAPGVRRGVPQGRHVHALLARGRQVLEELFPGLTAELVEHGTPTGDMLADTRAFFGGHWLRRADAGLTILSLTRPFLESHVRARVLALPNVTTAPPCDIVGVLASPDAGQVTGVTVFRRVDGSAAEELAADLIVDATGRASRTPRWLRDLGYEAPAEERVGIDSGYATAVYRLQTGASPQDLGCLIAPTPELSRGGAMARVEDDRWIVTLIGVLGDHPPTEPDAFAAFAGSLPVPDIHAAIRDGAPVTYPNGYRFPANRWLRYDRLSRFPAGLIVVGDAVCCLNPIYGQGMTVAALEALALRDALTGDWRLDARRLFRAVARILAGPWNMATRRRPVIPWRGRPASTEATADRPVPRHAAGRSRDRRAARRLIRARDEHGGPARDTASSRHCRSRYTERLESAIQLVEE